MKAGQTNIEVGARVKLCGINGEDKFLNGLTGTATHPFAFGETKKGWIGVRLDDECKNTPYGESINVHKNECILL